MKLLILANHYNTLRIFRRELLKALSSQHEVVVAMPPCDKANRDQIISYGTKVVFVAMSRRGMNPLADLKLFWDYYRLMSQERPDMVICYTVKCNIYGALACRLLGLPHYVNVTGLGTPLEKGGFAGWLVTRLYRFSLKQASAVFCENSGDGERLISGRMVRAEQLHVMPGAGVNLDEFAFTPYPTAESPVKFLFIGRIMQEKGVDELFEAIECLHADGIPFIFDFIGLYEEQYESRVRDMEARGLIRFHGFQSDVRPYIQDCHCSVLPSWHEGMSNTLLESASMGRPLITTRVHGCMEAVEEGVSGFLVPLRDAQALYQALKTFCLLPYAQKQHMGQAARRHVAKGFDKKVVVHETLYILLSRKEKMNLSNNLGSIARISLTLPFLNQMLGSTFAQAYSEWDTNRRFRNIEKFLENISERMKKVENSSSKCEYSDEKCEIFDMVLQKIQTIHSEQKRKHFENFIINSLTANIGYDKEYKFLTAIDEFLELHISVLKYLYDVKQKDANNCPSFNDIFDAVSRGQEIQIRREDVLAVLFDLCSRYCFVERSWTLGGHDQGRVLISTNLSIENISYGCYHRITDLGVNFYKFIVNDNISD